MATSGLVRNYLKGANTALPVWEKVNLLVNGSTPVTLNLTKTFHVVQRLIWHIRWSGASVSWTNFAGDAALTNGLDVLVGGVSLLGETIKDNEQFFEYGYDVVVNSDGGGTPGRVLTARWSFFKSAPQGLWHFDDEYKLQFKVSDNMTALTTPDEVVVVVQGYRAHD